MWHPAEGFYKDAQKATGYRPECKACTKANAAARYARDPEAHCAETTAWRKAHPESHRASARRYYHENREAIRARRSKKQ